jgi:uroporphyrinogen decarboxylase
MNPLQPEVMDVYGIKKKYGDRLIIDTGYPVMHLPFTTTDEIKERVKKDLKLLAPGGGFIYGTSHMALWNTPAQNVYTLAETIRKYAKYPIRVP